MNLKVLPCDCDCEKCRSMCHAPCCGTPEDIKNLMENGYGNRLMLDDWNSSGCPTLIKPALCTYEGEKAPFHTTSKKGCTFWKKGKCQLHKIGLKPLQGKLAHHDRSQNEINHIEYLIENSWNTENGSKVIEEWKNKFFKKEEEEEND